MSPVSPGLAWVRRQESTPTVVLFWRRWFTLFFLDVRYLIAQSVVINLLRALMPQRKEALTSFFGYDHSKYAPISRFHSCIWVLRDICVWAQMGVVLSSIAIRWLASGTSYVANRTKIIASGGEDTLASFLFSMSCSSMFFAGAAVLGLAIFEPIMLFVDYRRHGSMFMSLFLYKAQRVDVFLFTLYFFLALGSVAEHLSRREIITEDILYRTEIGKHITLCFRLKRQVSVVATLVWVAFFFCRKEGTSLLLAIRIIAAVFIAALFGLHAVASYYGFVHLVRTVNALDSDLTLTFQWHGLIPGFLLKWSPRRNHTQSLAHSLLRVAKNFFPIFLWHVSGRTVAAQLAMFLSLCNWLPLLPAVQIELYCCIAAFTAAGLLLFRLSSLMNPTCINTSGDDIPVMHVGFGMLVLKVQLLSCGEHAEDAHAMLKMVPASIERLAEAVTLSYRWDHATTFQVHVWHRETCMQVQFRMELLRRAFQLLEEQGAGFGDHTLIWFDQASIDQDSERFKALLVPRMTACYALSSLTLVLDNTALYELGKPDNYYSRIWTFQEYCIPPCIAVFTGSPQSAPAAVEANRRLIQDRYWSGAAHQRRAETAAAAAAAGATNQQQGQRQQQQQQLFLVVGLDSRDAIRQWLLDHPELLAEYLATMNARVGFKSSDRFAAIMQVVAGVICFTPEAVHALKCAVLSAIAQRQQQLHGCPLIDNTAAGAAAAAGTAAAAAAGQEQQQQQLCLLSAGTADASRLLAGKPCPGDHGDRASLTLADIAVEAAAAAEEEPQGGGSGGRVVLEAEEGEVPAALGGLAGCVEILGSYFAYGEPGLPPIRVKALVDPTTGALRQLLVWPLLAGGGGAHRHLQQQQRAQRTRAQLEGVEEEVEAAEEQQRGLGLGSGQAERLRAGGGLQLRRLDTRQDKWQIFFE